MKNYLPNSVLVVDDDVMIREIVRYMLTKMGFDVLEAKDGEKAIDIFLKCEKDICCILCDVCMPGIDGWTTISILRQIAPNIPVVMSSGNNHTKRPIPSLTFLAKPYGMSELRAAIRDSFD
jgi:two-component system cell cycle sensor histidine kinase/response regulator CckA